jgi:site-specific recombinase XerD
MRQGFNIQFYCRNTKRTKNGTAPLEISININGVRKFINLPYKLTPEEFHRKRRPRELEDYMASMRKRVNEILADMLSHGEPLTTESLISYIRNGGYKSYTVQNLFEDYLGILKGRVGKNLTQGVYRKYELVKELFLEDNDSFKECDCILTPAAILRFKAKVEGRYEQSTAAGYLRKMKTMVQFALDNGKIKTNPFQGVKIHKGEKPIIYLKEWEQKALKNAVIENASLDRVRDFSVLQLSTGMAYADMAALTKEDIQEKNGVYYIFKPRVKTGKVFHSVIVEPERFMAILDKYDGKVPVISNQKQNLWLKTLGGLLRISTPLTTHTFRRTYAMNLLNSGIRIETVAAAMGHDSKTCAKYYAKLKEDTILEEIAAKVG